MQIRLDLACFIACSLLGACSEELSNDGQDEGSEQDKGPSDERTLDGGRDASRMDASANDDDELDASRDAGRDASSVKRDASATDSSTHDAAPLSDASEPETDASQPVADAGASGGSADAGSAASCSELTYDSFGKQFLARYCAAVCHSSFIGTAGVKLDNLEDIAAASDRAKRAVVNRAMPPIPPGPSDEERARFAQWVDCGAR